MLDIKNICVFFCLEAIGFQSRIKKVLTQNLTSLSSSLHFEQHLAHNAGLHSFPPKCFMVIIFAAKATLAIMIPQLANQGENGLSQDIHDLSVSEVTCCYCQLFLKRNILGLGSLRCSSGALKFVIQKVNICFTLSEGHCPTVRRTSAPRFFLHSVHAISMEQGCTHF